MKMLVKVVLVFAMAFAGCDSEPKPEPAAADAASTPSASPQGERSTDYETNWRLLSGEGPDGTIPIVEGWDVTLQIEAGRIAGRSACNSYGARVEIDRSFFQVRRLGGTSAGCPGQVGLSEERYIAGIQAADRIERRGGTLLITGAEVRLLFERIPRPPIAELVGTTWELQALLEPDGTSQTAPISPAILRLQRSGTFSATTGCRRLEGEWIESVGEIVFTEMRAIGRCGEELSQQDDRIVGALGDGFKASAVAKQLTIVNARGGATLVYDSR